LLVIRFSLVIQNKKGLSEARAVARCHSLNPSDPLSYSGLNEP